jgi:putative tributyrin esterase
LALCEIKVGSRVLEKMTALRAIVPDGPGPFPVFYLLHGLSDDYTCWTRYTNVERYLGDLPMIIVMPDGGRGFYSDSLTNPLGHYERYITEDLISFIDNTFHTVPTREKRAIGGLSMGGYGGLKLALKYPDLFCAGVSHSGAVNYFELTETDPVAWSREWKAVFGDSPSGGPNDILALLEGADRTKLPAIWMDCGDEDFLLEENRLVHNLMVKLNIPHQYAEMPGNHNWTCWDANIQKSLPFVAKALGIATP